MSIGLEMYRNPLTYPPYCQYIAPQGYHFMWNGENLGRYVWIRNNEIGNYYIEKDETNTD